PHEFSLLTALWSELLDHSTCHFLRAICAQSTGGEGRRSMGVARALLAIIASAASLGGCQAPQQTFERVVYGDPGKAYLGMTKEQIIACAGKPYNSYATGKGETLTYHYSG